MPPIDMVYFLGIIIVVVFYGNMILNRLDKLEKMEREYLKEKYDG